MKLSSQHFTVALVAVGNALAASTTSEAALADLQAVSMAPPATQQVVNATAPMASADKAAIERAERQLRDDIVDFHSNIGRLKSLGVSSISFEPRAVCANGLFTDIASGFDLQVSSGYGPNADLLQNYGAALESGTLGTNDVVKLPAFTLISTFGSTNSKHFEISLYDNGIIDTNGVPRLVHQSKCHLPELEALNLGALMSNLLAQAADSRQLALAAVPPRVPDNFTISVHPKLIVPDEEMARITLLTNTFRVKISAEGPNGELGAFLNDSIDLSEIANRNQTNHAILVSGLLKYIKLDRIEASGSAQLPEIATWVDAHGNQYRWLDADCLLVRFPTILSSNQASTELPVAIDLRKIGLGELNQWIVRRTIPVVMQQGDLSIYSFMPPDTVKSESAALDQFITGAKQVQALMGQDQRARVSQVAVSPSKMENAFYDSRNPELITAHWGKLRGSDVAATGAHETWHRVDFGFGEISAGPIADFHKRVKESADEFFYMLNESRFFHGAIVTTAGHSQDNHRELFASTMNSLSASFASSPFAKSEKQFVLLYAELLALIRKQMLAHDVSASVPVFSVLKSRQDEVQAHLASLR